MATKHLSYLWHKDTAKHLREIRMTLLDVMTNPEFKKDVEMYKIALDALDKLRSKLDDVVCAENKNMSNDEVFVYYK